MANAGVQPYIVVKEIIEAGPHLPTPEGCKAELALGGWLHTEITVRHRELNPGTVTHPSTNRAQRNYVTLGRDRAMKRPVY